MKTLFCLVLVVSVWLTQGSAWANVEECFKELPGEMNIPIDTPGRVRMSELIINPQGAKAFIATEYLGSGNLQASVYLLQQDRYCLAGDLGASTDVKGSVKAKSDGYYGLVVESKSGPDKFYRTFEYKAGRYQLRTCIVKTAGSNVRRCRVSEK